MLMHSLNTSVCGRALLLVYFKALMTHINNLFVVSGLLVTGRSGAGKTSIVRSVAKSVQEDPRTLACKAFVSTHTYQSLMMQTSTMSMLQSCPSNLSPQ